MQKQTHLDTNSGTAFDKYFQHPLFFAILFKLCYVILNKFYFILIGCKIFQMTKIFQRLGLKLLCMLHWSQNGFLALLHVWNLGNYFGIIVAQLLIMKVLIAAKTNDCQMWHPSHNHKNCIPKWKKKFHRDSIHSSFSHDETQHDFAFSTIDVLFCINEIHIHSSQLFTFTLTIKFLMGKCYVENWQSKLITWIRIVTIDVTIIVD